VSLGAIGGTLGRIGGTLAGLDFAPLVVTDAPYPYVIDGPTILAVDVEGGQNPQTTWLIDRPDLANIEPVTTSGTGTIGVPMTVVPGVYEGPEPIVLTYEWHELGDALPPPQNTSPPTITGTAREGSTLTANPGTYANLFGVTLTYTWHLGDTMAAIPGATGRTFVPTSEQFGKTIYVVETATSPAGTTQTSSAPVGPVEAFKPAGQALLEDFLVWLNGKTDLVAGATGTITPTRGNTITIGATTGATATDPTITSTSVIGDGVDDHLIFGNTPSLTASDSFTVVLALKAPTRKTSGTGTFFTTNSGTSSSDGFHIYSEATVDRVAGRLRNSAANQTVAGNLLPSIYNGALWIVVGQVSPTDFKVQTYDGTTLTSQTTSRIAGNSTQAVAPRLFGTNGPAPGEVFACAYTQATFTDAQIKDIGDYLRGLYA
jgi:hypothetical protein